MKESVRMNKNITPRARGSFFFFVGSSLSFFEELIDKHIGEKGDLIISEKQTKNVDVNAKLFTFF